MKAKTMELTDKIGLAALLVCLPFISCNLEADRITEKEQEWTEETGDPIEVDWENFSGRTVFINPNAEYQEMKGFGASDCWDGNWVGQYWNDPGLAEGVGAVDKIKEQIAEWLFSQDFDEDGNPLGIGLSQWRVNMGAGSHEQGNSSRIGTINYNASNQEGRWDRRAESFLKGSTGPEIVRAAEANDPAERYDWTKQAGQQYFFKKAKDLGTEILIAFSNSPVVPWTLNGYANNSAASANTPGSNGRYTAQGNFANLKDLSPSRGSFDGYGAFAGYLADVAEHFTQEGYRFDFIAPVNEPQWEWNEDKQEGSPWLNSEIAHIAQELNTAIQSRSAIANKTKIMITEAAQWDHIYTGGSAANQRTGQLDAFFNPANTATYIGDLPAMRPNMIGGHTYYTHANDATLRSHRTQLKTKADSLGVEVYSTEWCLLTGGEGLSNPATANYYDIALYMSKLCHSDITIGGITSWTYWTAMDMEMTGRDRYTLIGLSPGSPNTYDIESYKTHNITESGSIKSMPTLWALGNYSLFVRPGFKRIGITKVDDTEEGNNNITKLMATAYKSPAGYTDKEGNPVDRIVVVYVNMTTASAQTAAIFTNGKLPIGIRCFRTDAANTGAENGGGLGMRYEGHAQGVITVPPRSVYTVVYDFPVE
jgi:O-glycosyl hydrolase